MWALLSDKTKIYIIVASAVFCAYAVDGLYTLAAGEPPGILKTISIAVSIIGTVAVFMLNLVWRWVWQRVPILWSKVFPDLNGEWTGLLISTWVNPETNKTVDPIPSKLIIHQGLFKSHICMKTAESTSDSTRVILEKMERPNCFRIWYSYNNDPQAQFRHRSSPHEGVAFLEIDTSISPFVMRGRYYTARKTTGDMEYTKSGS